MAAGRALGAMEHGIWRADLGAPLNFTTVARVSGPLTEEALVAALEAVRARHPCLRTRIAVGAGVPSFRTEGVPPLRLRVIRGAEASWRQELEREMNEPIPWETGPLARFVLVERDRDRHLLATLHHSIGDGMSGAYLVRDLVACAAQAVAGGVPALPVLPDAGPLDARLPASVRGLAALGFRVRYVLAEAWKDVRHGRARRVRRDRDVFAYARRARVIPHLLDEATARLLVERARREETTVHGALSAALILGTLADAGVKRARVVFGSPVNVRDQLVPPVGEDVGLFVSMLGFSAPVRTDVPFWDLARAVRRQLEADLRRNAPLAMLAFMPIALRLLGAYRLPPRRLVERWERNIRTTTGLTNLGRLTIETRHGPLSIEECHFAAAPSALGDFLATATSLHGRIQWNFVWTDPLLDEAHATALVNDIVHRLHAALDATDAASRAA